MNEIRIADNDLANLRSRLVGYEVEHCAVLLAALGATIENSTCLLVRETHFPNAEDYLSQSDTFAQLTPEFVAKITKIARNSKLQLIFVHSHLAPLPPIFSHTDDQGEQVLAKFLSSRGLIDAHAAMVLSPVGIAARKLGTCDEMAVISIGHRRIVEFPPLVANDTSAEQYDRQIRAFGLAGQQAIQRLRIAIVGLGGTGSVLAQQLVHLGVREFLLIDPDTLECTNLNRVVGARESDIGAPKVQIAQRYLEDFSNQVGVQTIMGDVCRAQIAKELASADFIFGCTDSHGSRSVIQQIAYQYLIPCIDMGSTITAPKGEVTGIYGRVQLLSPGHGCLWCSGLLNSEEIRRDMLSERERKMDPYIPGSREPAPSVISLNSTVVSMAVSMFLNVVTEIPGDARHLVYDARASKLRSVAVKSTSDCFICSTNGVLARGNGQPLFARQD
jgi:molybdopterin-synthase adenylyltransferase